MAVEEENLVVISAETISQQKVIEFVTHSSAGGIAVFIGEQCNTCNSMSLFFPPTGTTRDNFQGKGICNAA